MLPIMSALMFLALVLAGSASSPSHVFLPCAAPSLSSAGWVQPMCLRARARALFTFRSPRGAPCRRFRPQARFHLSGCPGCEVLPLAVAGVPLLKRGRALPPLGPEARCGQQALGWCLGGFSQPSGGPELRGGGASELTPKSLSGGASREALGQVLGVHLCECIS